MTMVSEFVPPETLGACADLLYKLKAERLAAQKVVEALEVRESALKTHIINTLPKSDASGVAGKVARVTVVTKQVPQVCDWGKLYAYVKRTGQFELLQRRVSDAAVKERWENGKAVPGVDAFTAVSVSLNKL